MNEAFCLKKNVYLILNIFRFLCFLMNPQTSKFMMSSQTLLHIRKYDVSIKMNLGKILV